MIFSFKTFFLLHQISGSRFNLADLSRSTCSCFISWCKNKGSATIHSLKNVLTFFQKNCHLFRLWMCKPGKWHVEMNWIRSWHLIILPWPKRPKPIFTLSETGSPARPIFRVISNNQTFILSPLRPDTCLLVGSCNTLLS